MTQIRGLSPLDEATEKLIANCDASDIGDVLRVAMSDYKKLQDKMDTLTLENVQLRELVAEVLSIMLDDKYDDLPKYVSASKKFIEKARKWSA